MDTVIRGVAWETSEPFGAEFAEVTILPRRLRASGVTIGSAPVPYRLDYTIDSDAGFGAGSIEVTARGEGWRRALRLGRAAKGGWSASVEQEGWPPLPEAKVDLAGIADAMDFDLGLSQLTNTMHVLRTGLIDAGGTAEFSAAWISARTCA